MGDNSDLLVLGSSFGFVPVQNKFPPFLENGWRQRKFGRGSEQFVYFVEYISEQTEALYSDLRGHQAIERETDP